MDGVLGISANGMQIQSLIISNASQNIANLSTDGYGAQVQDFGGAGQTSVRPNPTQLQNVGLTPGSSVSDGSELLGSYASFGTTLQPDANPLAIGINGQGFIAVKQPNGQTSYTRDGNLTVDATGQLVTMSGDLVQPAIKAPSGSQLQIASDGTVTAVTGSQQQVVGHLTLATFANPSGLQNVGGNLYQATANSGTPQVVTPGQGGSGTLEAGMVNASNVSLSTSMVQLVQAQTAYQMSASLASSDQTLTTRLETL